MNSDSHAAAASLVVCVSGNTTPGWRWIGPALQPEQNALEVHDCVPVNAMERRIRRPYLPRYRASIRAALAARSPGAVVVSHGPLMTLWTALAMQLVGSRAPHLAFAFNFTNLPRGPRLRLMRHAFRRVDRFVVPSTLERELYSGTFGLPPERFDVLLWGIRKPEVPSGEPPFVRDAPYGYVCALGGEGRDYATLFDAARLAPEIPIVCIGRPSSFAGLTPPANVRTHVNVPPSVAWNVLAHSRFCVVPLRDAEVPCGHVTLVAAMHHAKALVVTNSRGVADYVKDGENALLVPPGRPKELASGLQTLWHDHALSERLGERGNSLVKSFATEDATVDYVKRTLAELGSRP